MLRKLLEVLLVLVMLGSVVSPAMAATEKIDKNTRKINMRTEIFRELDNLKAKLGMHNIFKIEVVKKFSKKEDVEKIVTNIVKTKLDNIGLNKKDKIKIIKTIQNYLKSKKLKSPVIAKIKWLPEGEESIAVFDNGKIVFDSYTWFYGTKFVAKKNTKSYGNQIRSLV